MMKDASYCNLGREESQNLSWLPALLLILVGASFYHNSLSGHWLFDDYSCIPENPHIRSLWPLSRAVGAPPETAMAGRPVAALSLALNYAWGGLDVRGYHLVNLLFHLGSALLLFGIVRRTLRSLSPHDRFSRQASGLAFAVALLWMIHPLLTESVTYIVQRTELLVGLCLLLTLYSVIRGAASAHPRRWDAAAIGACALGMASKEVMVVAPFLVLFYDRTFLAGSFRTALRQRRRLYMGLALSWLILAGLLATGSRTTTAGFGVKGLTPWAYALTQFGVIVHYLRLVVWPHPLVADYSDWPVAQSVAEVLPQAVLVAVLVGGTLWSLRRARAVGFLGAWFFLILAPSSSIVPILTEVAAERRMYLPLAAPITLAVLGGWTLLRRLISDGRRQRRVAIALLVLLVGGLGGLTIRRNHDYQSEIAMLEDVIAKRPNNFRAYYNLGIALAEQGKRKEAVAQFAQALRLKPDYAEAHGNLGLVLAQQGRSEEAAAHYAEALRLDPTLAAAHPRWSKSVQQALASGRQSDALTQPW